MKNVLLYLQVTRITTATMKRKSPKKKRTRSKIIEVNEANGVYKEIYSLIYSTSILLNINKHFNF